HAPAARALPARPPPPAGRADRRIRTLILPLPAARRPRRDARPDQPRPARLPPGPLDPAGRGGLLPGHLHLRVVSGGEPAPFARSGALAAARRGADRDPAARPRRRAGLRRRVGA